ncbi:MAG: helix-turn-helix domain-containing protein, partial [Alphaproteobacteria bacterium]|nr:helix-turn-helix domain-containing protein [Alphaproteobacteria bacterium]
MLKRVPAEVFPPGEFIREELEARAWTQEDLAQIMGRPVRLVNELVNAKKQITPDTARGLAEAFGTDPLYWMNLDSAYRLSNTDPVDAAVSRRAQLYGKFPIREMTKRGWVIASDNLDVTEHNVLQFFRLKAVSETPAFAHAAKASDYNERTPLQLAWLFRAKQLSEAVSVAKYDDASLRRVIAKLKALRIAAEEIRQVPSLLAQAGVRFVIVEFLPGAKIDGAAFWLDAERPVIAMSLRFDRIDNFWFVLRHEIEHVLNRDGMSEEGFTIDIELSEKLERNEVLPKEEVIANEAAAEFCVPKAEIDNFISRVRP